MVAFRKIFATILLVYSAIAAPPFVLERQVTPVLLGIAATSIGGAFGSTVMGGMVTKVLDLFRSFKQSKIESKAEEEARAAQIQKAFDDYKVQQDEKEKERMLNQLAMEAQEAKTVDANDQETMASLTASLKKVFENHIFEEQAKDAKDKADLKKEMAARFGKLEADRQKDKMDAKDEKIKELEAAAVQDHNDDNSAANMRAVERLEKEIADLKASLGKPPRRMLRFVR